MNFFQRIVFVDEQHAISVFSKNSGEDGRVHARTERTLEIVVIYDGDLGVFIAARRTTLELNFLHRVGIRIGGQIELGHTHQRLVVFRQKKLKLLLLCRARKRDRHRVVIWEVARVEGPQQHLYVGRQRIMRTNLALDRLHKVRRSERTSGRFSRRRRGRRLSRTTQTDQQKNQKRTPHNHQLKPPEHEEDARLSHGTAPCAGTTPRQSHVWRRHPRPRAERDDHSRWQKRPRLRTTSDYRPTTGFRNSSALNSCFIEPERNPSRSSVTNLKP